MRKKKSGTLKQVTTRLQDEEWTVLEKKIAQTTCRSVSEYFRKVIMEEPVRVLHRSQSLDDLIREACILRKELEAIPESKRLDSAERDAFSVLMYKIWNCMEKIAHHVVSNKL